MELLLALDLIVGTINIFLFSACVWVGFQKAKENDRSGKS